MFHVLLLMIWNLIIVSKNNKLRDLLPAPSSSPLVMIMLKRTLTGKLKSQQLIRVFVMILFSGILKNMWLFVYVRKYIFFIL